VRLRPCAVVILAVLIQASLPTLATACSCVTSPHSCQDLPAAAAVFEATVEDIDVHPGEPIGDFQTQELHVRLQDTQTLRGAPQDVVVTAADTCAYPFVKGTRYLIVANRRESDHRLVVSLCGLTRPLDQAGGFLDYVRSLEKPATGSHVFGIVSMPARWVEFSASHEPLANVRVQLSGPVVRSTTTGPDGRYRIAGLPSGTYRLRVDPSNSFPYLGRMDQEIVRFDKKYSCAAYDFVAPSRSHVTGLVVDERTHPHVGIFMMLRPSDDHNSKPGDPGRRVETNQDGRYTFPDLPPGRYVVSVSEPFSHAEARTEHGETIILLRRGEHVTMETLWVKRDIGRHEDQGTAADHAPGALSRLAEKASGSVSGEWLPGGRRKAMRLASRSKSFGSKRAAAFITEAQPHDAIAERTTRPHAAGDATCRPTSWGRIRRRSPAPSTSSRR
jgi:hypothetical protein